LASSRLAPGLPITLTPWAEKKLRYIALVRICAGGSVRSTTAAVPSSRRAPPVPVRLSWQPPAAQVLLPAGPGCGVASTACTQAWK
jgi:hypothetical protein